ncbi:TTL [Symbiodinium sp. CCMP2592]|nr:TTL [Symbiodinium sp. CCMP2592]
MGPGDQSVYVLPAITGRCLEVLPRPIKLQRSLRGRLSRSRPVAKTCFSKDEDAPKSEVDLEVPDASPIQRSASSVLPLTDSWSTPSLSESSERTPSLRPFSASSHRDVHGTRHLGPLEAAGEDRLAMSAKDAKRRRRVRRATTKTVERSADTKTSSVREAKLKLFYVVQFGNNSGLIRDLLKHRRIWFPGPGDPGYLGRRQEAPCTMKLETAADAPEIQLLWSQYVVRDFLNAMAEEQEGWIVSYNDETKIRLERRETAAGPVGVRAHNHFEKNALISSKAGLRETMVGYYTSHSRDPFGAIPMTFVVRTGSGDPEFVRWLESFEELRARKESVWLVKPGDKANQGKGIVICDSVEEVRDAIDSKSRSWVIQKYIEKPFLIHKRKFDIRSYCLLAQDPEGVLHGYFYRQAYLRTTSSNFTLATKDRFVHLNNDAVQKHGDSYGKFEAANKMSLSEFQSYLDAHHGRDCLSIHSGLLPQMKALMADTLRAVGPKINPRGIQHCFEVFGFDFMVDEHFRVWLIEVNTNPSLDPCCSLLLSMIPKMLDEALSLSLDKIFGDAKAAGHTAWESIYNSEERVEEAGSGGTLSERTLAMIKRALGLFAGGEGAAEEDDDSDDAVSRILVCADLDSHTEDSEGSSDNDSDDDPPVPDAEEIARQAGSLTIHGQHEETFRGQYHCQLCPDKILLTEKQLEVHLQSGAHKRKERHFERAKAMGLEAYEAECLEKAAAREAQAAAQSAGVLSKKKQKNAHFWKQRKERRLQARKAGSLKGPAKAVLSDRIEHCAECKGASVKD